MVDLYGELQQGLPDKDFIAMRAFVAYQTDLFTIGAEVFTQTQNNVKSDSTNATPLVSQFSPAAGSLRTN